MIFFRSEKDLPPPLPFSEIFLKNCPFFANRGLPYRQCLFSYSTAFCPSGRFFSMPSPPVKVHLWSRNMHFLTGYCFQISISSPFQFASCSKNWVGASTEVEKTSAAKVGPFSSWQTLTPFLCRMLPLPGCALFKLDKAKRLNRCSFSSTSSGAFSTCTIWAHLSSTTRRLAAIYQLQKCLSMQHPCLNRLRLKEDWRLFLEMLKCMYFFGALQSFPWQHYIFWN